MKIFWEKYDGGGISRKFCSEQILLCVELVLRLKDAPDLQYKILDKLLWTWTEFDEQSGTSNKSDTNKKLSQRFWSEEALELYRNNRGLRGITSQLQHEHVVPKNIIIKRILTLDLDDSLSSKLNWIFENYALAAIVTEKDHDKLKEYKYNKDMPAGFYDREHSDDNVSEFAWMRYYECGIPVKKVRYDRATGELVDIGHVVKINHV